MPCAGRAYPPLVFRGYDVVIGDWRDEPRCCNARNELPAWHFSVPVAAARSMSGEAAMELP